VLGVPFYLMEHMSGSVITNKLPEALDNPDDHARISDELIGALVEIHAVDWRAAGLGSFGKPSGYLERQLRRFNGLWEINKTRELPLVQEVGDWLASNMPESPDATIVHGDFRLGNTMFATGAPARLVAVFDWEMATIGDPLADLGYLCTTWSEAEDPPLGRFELGRVTRAAGFPTRAELVARYEERSGRAVGDLRWYQALALWKSIVFMEGNYRRAVEGRTDDPYLKSFGEGVLLLAERAEAVAFG
jgi:aminoglycoside phosphotransferase (APT) family kinase protein